MIKLYILDKDVMIIDTNKIELFINHEDCTGCGICTVICPVNAIEMREDSGGSLYPSIDHAKCCTCRRCIKFCSELADVQLNHPITTFLAQSRLDDLKLSSSGGGYASIANSILKIGGKVSGVVLNRIDSGFECKQKLISETSQLAECRGSKYVQSSLTEIAMEILQEAESADSNLFFCGTPCQVASIKTLTKGKDINLYTADLVCHGVPSISLFNKYIQEQEDRYQKIVTKFIFRDKSNGWKLQARMEYKNIDGGMETKLLSPEKSSYYSEFLKGSTYRDSCYKCKYAQQNRVGDITLGDYWNVDLADPKAFEEMKKQSNNEIGYSVLSINTKKGLELIRKFGSDLILIESDYLKAAKYNSQMIKPSQSKLRKADKMLTNYSRYEDRHRLNYMLILLNRGLRKMIPKSIKGFIRKRLKVIS